MATRCRPMEPEHYRADLAAMRRHLDSYRERAVEDLRTATDPRHVAWLEGRFTVLRGLLQELEEMADAWEKGCPAFRATERMLESGR